MELSTKTKPATCEKHGDYESRGVGLMGKTIWLGCPTCGEEERQRREKEQAETDARERQERLESRLNRAGIPLRFRTKSFETFKCDSDGKDRALSVAMEFAANFEQHRRNGTVVVFSGKPGTGKSHLATAIGQEVLQTGTVLYVSAIDAVRMVRDTWRKGSEKSETQVLEMLASLDLLIIDEVGVQYGTEAEQVTLFDIIDKRYRDQMPMILLTNLNTAEMKKFLGDRSYDRLREGGKWIAFDWESQRGKAAA
jgi:DNA replication protein DnaC